MATSPKKRSWEGELIENQNSASKTNSSNPDLSSPNTSTASSAPNSSAKINKLSSSAIMSDPAPAAAKEQKGGVSNIQSIFEGFRSELDEHHDRRERIIKASRDITALSKKIIFALQRIRQIPSPTLPPAIAKEVHPKFTQISTLFSSIVADLSTRTTGPNPWRYQRQISPGIQEFIEALSFYHYVRTQRLITLDEVRASEYLPQSQARVEGEGEAEAEEEGSSVLITEEDYLMGVFDLSGEVMRVAVTLLSNAPTTTTAAATPGFESEGVSPSARGHAQTQQTTGKGRALQPDQAAIVKDLRVLRARCEALNIPRRHAAFMMRDLVKKLEVMQNSVEKVERAAYGILVRGSERPSGWMPDLGGSTMHSTGNGSAGGAEVETY